MIFNSLAFALFFPLVTLVYFVLAHRFRWIWLLGASCFFYMFFRPAYILILAFMIVVDYFTALQMEKSKTDSRKKIFLLISILVNLSMLAFFKYYAFLNDFLSSLFSLQTGDSLLPAFSFLLPIGLSFHTFQSMSYSIEVYSGNQKAEKHFGIFALYVMFYPQLVAGPIERPGHLLPQLKTPHVFEYGQVSSGLRRMLWGLFKKMVIADRLAVFVDPVFDNPHAYSGFPLIWAALFYTFQIYCDFSGYTDIALGAARVMGFHLTENFRSPLFSRSVTEFWQRWHISLTSWLYDYVFKPLSFAKRNWGLWGSVFAVLVTFFLCGLWHGAKWNFVAWGVLNGIALSFEILTQKARKKYFPKNKSKIISLLCTLITFSFICLSFVVARSASFPDAGYILSQLDNLDFRNWIGLPIITGFSFTMNFVFIIILIASEWFFLNPGTRLEWPQLHRPAVHYSVNAFLVICILLFGVFEQQAFIYFQF